MGVLEKWPAVQCSSNDEANYFNVVLMQAESPLEYQICRRPHVGKLRWAVEVHSKKKHLWASAGEAHPEARGVDHELTKQK